MLKNFDLQLWYPRKLRHTWYHEKAIIVEVLPVIFKAKCLVLLSIAQQKQELAPEVNKILLGMLSVLKLSKEELSLAKVYTKNNCLTEQDWQQVFMQVKVWQPRFILQLDKTVPAVINNEHIRQTYHPEHLFNNPHDKNLAYQDLLTMKKILHTYDHNT